MRLIYLGLLIGFASGLGAQTYQLSQEIKLGGSGGWDYLYSDTEARRLYVSHASAVFVIDEDSKQQIGVIDGFQFVHGIITVPKLKIGFISDGKQNRVAMFDLATLRVIKSIETVANPNSMALDANTGRLFVGHKPSHSMTVIDTKTQSVVSSVALDGVPEFPVADGNQTILVNIDDKSEIGRIDTKTMKVIGYWPLGACKNPSGLALDPDGHTLFSTCRNGMMAVVDSANGHILAMPSIGAGPDAARYDKKTQTAFSSNGDGTLTVVSAAGVSSTVRQVVLTQTGGRTMALDEKTGAVFISTSDFAAPEPNAPIARPAPLDGTFRVLVVTRTGK